MNHTVTFTVRRAVPEDALAILEAHRAAIRGSSAETAYSREVIEGWAPLHIPPERVEGFTRVIEQGEEVVLVAEDQAGQVMAFGSIVPRNSELRAVYVNSAYARKGIGRAILEQLEELAREAGMTELRMDASINAQAFYEASGFISLERAEHVAQSGLRMACIRMKKSL